jgi:hypothetical protein
MEDKGKNKTQYIDGHQHQIAGGNITNITEYSEPEFGEGNPNKIACPQCDKMTGRYSATCKNCDFEVRKHFDSIAEDEYRRAKAAERMALNNKGWILTAIGMAGFIGTNYIGWDNLYVLGAFGMCAAVGCFLMRISS